jgi:hypothetical protein
MGGISSNSAGALSSQPRARLSNEAGKLIEPFPLEHSEPRPYQGWCRSAPAATCASPEGTPPRSWRSYAWDACWTAHLRVSTRNWANMTLAEAVPLEADLGASSQGCVMMIDAGRRPPSMGGTGPAAPAPGGALDGPLRRPCSSFVLPLERLEWFTMVFRRGRRPDAPKPPTWRAS